MRIDAEDQRFDGSPLSRRLFLRRAAAAGLSLSALGGIAACGGGNGTQSTATDTAESAATGVTTPPSTTASPASLAGDVTVFTGPFSPDDPSWQKQYASRFQQDFEDVTVKVEFFDWSAFDANYTTALARSDPPDVLYVAPIGKTPGAFLDLTDRVTGDPTFQAVRDAITEPQWRSTTVDGKILGIPAWRGPNTHLVNVDLMEKAGISDWTSSWDALRTAAHGVRQLSADTYGFIMPETYKDYSWWIWLPLLWSAGGDLVNQDGTAAALNSPEAIQAFDLLRAIYAEDKSAPEPGLFDLQGLQGLFTAGRVGIFANSQQSVGVLAGAPKPVAFKWDIMIWPAGPAGQPVSADGVGAWSISAKSDSPDAAWEYIKYMLGDYYSLDWLKKINGQLLPVRTDITDAFVAELAAHPFIAGIEKNIDLTVATGRPLPSAAFPFYFQALDAVSREVEKLLRGETTGRDAARSGNDAINAIIASST